MEWLDAIPTTGVTAVTLFIILYFGQLRGWFYTKPQVEEIRSDRDNRIQELQKNHAENLDLVRSTLETRLADKEEIISNLAQANSDKDEALKVARSQISRLLDGVETTAAVVQAIPRSVER